MLGKAVVAGGYLGLLLTMAAAQPLSTSRRESLCLNGVWRFMPAIGPALEEPVSEKAAWGLIRVPGR